jgi:hypothetical protein
VTEVTDKVERAIARFERVTKQIDDRQGPARDAARRERERLNSGLTKTIATVVVAVGAVWLAAIFIGLLLKPIGMFGFLAAIVASVIAIGLVMGRGAKRAVSPPAPAPDLPNGLMVERFDSYLYRARRALPAAAQGQIDAISGLLPSLRETLERVETLDPNAQDARRLMSTHLPGLIDHYVRVPPAFRQDKDGEGKTVDEGLVEGLAAGRQALGEIAQQLARADMAAFETQGRFIKSRYGEERIDS